MTANELRIGNLIQDTRHPERECVVHRLTAGIDFSITYRYDKSKELSYSKENNDALKGIPLTEDWLKRAGFELTERGTYHIPKTGRFVYHPDYGWKILENWVRGWVNVQEPIYVHQLQNLYFALTGEELQFTQP